MVLKGWLMSDFENKEFQKFVDSGDWYLDTQAPDYKEKLLADVMANQTPQNNDDAETDDVENWYEEE